MRPIFIAAMLFMAIQTMAESRVVKSDIKNVTVFTQGAQIFRSATVTLDQGMTDLIFSGLSSSINPSSIQAGGNGKIVILDVKHRVKYPEPKKNTGELPKEITREIKSMEDSSAEIEFKLNDLNEVRSTLLMEKDMILKNKLSKGEGKSDSLAVLKDAMDFFRNKLSDINQRLARLKREEKKLTEQNTAVKAHLAELRAYKSTDKPEEKYEPLNQVIVTVSADEPTTGNVNISYMVSQAGWVPSYDLRSTTSSEPVEITYKANIHQSSGEDWNNVRLKVSTSNPNRSNMKPALPPWYLNYFTATRELTVAAGARAKDASNTYLNKEEMLDMKKQLDELSPAQSAANYSQLVQTMANVMFDINLTYNIPSDGEKHIVSIKKSELPASYYHYLVPKIESEAFLVARITGWENLNLLPGTANVFYEGTYVGQTVINPNVINDTIDLAFGRDKGVMVTRTKETDKDNNKLLGNDVTKTLAYTLRIKNNKQKEINLVVEDQMPLTLNKDIKIETIDTGQAEFDQTSGALKWKFPLNAKEYKTLTFSYAITYDKNKMVSLY